MEITTTTTTFYYCSYQMYGIVALKLGRVIDAKEL